MAIILPLAARAADFTTSDARALEINDSEDITTGVWSGAAIGAAYGGTGDTTLTSNGVLYGVTP
jgi:hypothetical protein